jgi:hypothetical protein
MLKTFQFKVLVSRDSDLDVWVARGVNFDIVAQSKNLEGLNEAFVRAVSAQAFADVKNNRAPLQDCPPAPGHVWEAFEKAPKGLLDLSGSKPQGIPVPADCQIAAEFEEMRICA